MTPGGVSTVHRQVKQSEAIAQEEAKPVVHKDYSLKAGEKIKISLVSWEFVPASTPLAFSCFPIQPHPVKSDQSLNPWHPHGNCIESPWIWTLEHQLWRYNN